jgi:hypothetical protein
MSWAMELTPAGFGEILVDLGWMDRKTGFVYVRLVG